MEIVMAQENKMAMNRKPWLHQGDLISFTQFSS